MQKIKLPPKSKLNGMRFGQWLYNQLDQRNRAIVDGKTYSWNSGIGEELFYISNKDLEKIINKAYEKKAKKVSIKSKKAPQAPRRCNRNRKKGRKKVQRK